MYEEPEDVLSVSRLTGSGGMKIRGAANGPLFEYPAVVGWGGPVLDADIVVIDFETTGFSARTDRIIEMAAARLNPDREMVSEFATVVDPGNGRLGPVSVHQITAEDLRGAPTFPELYDTLCDFLDGAVVVAHNAVFEEWFFGNECVRHGLPLPRNHAIDTLYLSQLVTTQHRHGLGRMAAHFGVEQYRSHHAIGDVYATLDVVLPILERRPQLVWKSRRPRESRVPVIGCEIRPR